jgi:P4 family phage/plasmid primase-like protien
MFKLATNLDEVSADTKIAEPLWLLGDRADVADIIDEASFDYAGAMLEKGIDHETLQTLKDDGPRNSHGVPSKQYDLGATLEIGSDVEISRRIAESLKKRHGEVVHSEGHIWNFNGVHWEPFAENELRLIIHRFDGANISGSNSHCVKLSKRRIDSIRSELAVILDEPEFFANPNVGINCASGFIKFDEAGSPWLVPHHPDHRIRHMLVARWPQKKLECQPDPPLLKKLLRGCFIGDDDADEKIALVAEIAGAAALGYATRLVEPKAVIFHGDTAGNGKSQILDLLRSLLPPGASACIPLGKLSDEKHLCCLAGVHLNASDEITSAKAIASDAFKQVVTGEPTTARDVYQPVTEVRPIAQHVFATNSLPSFSGGMDRGVRRRLIVLQFNRTIPTGERVSGIASQIAEEEADALLEWAVRGAARLLRHQRFSTPPSSEAALRDWLSGADPVLAWLEDKCRVDLEAPDIRTASAYEAFKKWAILDGYRENALPAKNVFTKRVFAAYDGITTKRLSAGMYFVGLRLSK